jgi:cytochrome b involved in lipid metabolism
MNKGLIVAIFSAILITGVLGYFGYSYYVETQLDNISSNLEEQKEKLSQIPQDQRCVITISEKKYDVTMFKDVHPGGNVFKCGQDMTQAFNKQHGKNQKVLNTLKNFLVEETSPSSETISEEVNYNY